MPDALHSAVRGEWVLLPFPCHTPMQLDTAVCQALGGRPDLAELDISSFAQLLLPRPASLSLYEARLQHTKGAHTAAKAGKGVERPQGCACCVA